MLTTTELCSKTSCSDACSVELTWPAVQKSGAEDEAEQVLDVLMSKGATEAALADEMGRLRVQEEVTPFALLVCFAVDSYVGSMCALPSHSFRLFSCHGPSILPADLFLSYSLVNCSSLSSYTPFARRTGCNSPRICVSLHHLPVKLVSTACSMFIASKGQQRSSFHVLQIIRNHRLEREADYAEQREREWERALAQEAQRHR